MGKRLNCSNGAQGFLGIAAHRGDFILRSAAAAAHDPPDQDNWCHYERHEQEHYPGQLQARHGRDEPEVDRDSVLVRAARSGTNCLDRADRAPPQPRCAE